jgi:hypothetical protein
MNVFTPKNTTDLTISTPVITRNGAQRSRPAATDAGTRLARARWWWRNRNSPISTAGGMNKAVAPRPSEMSAGVASTGRNQAQVHVVDGVGRGPQPHPAPRAWMICRHLPTMR